MRILITRRGGPETLETRPYRPTEPAPGEVLIRVAYAGVNFDDVMARKGLYPDAPPLPFVPGYEVSGTVEKVGPGLDRSQVGRRVLALTRFGGYASAVTVPASQVFECPDTVPLESAAALPVNYLTAWMLLHHLGALKKGETLLLHNAGGGVGGAALQLALHSGARVLGTASPWKHSALLDAGLSVALDGQGAWEKEVLEATGGKGVDLALDPFGGQHAKRSFSVLRKGGRLGLFGVSTAAETPWAFWGLLRLALTTPWFHPFSLMNANRGVFGVNLGRLWDETERMGGWMREILRWTEEGVLKPRVDRIVPAARAMEAHMRLEGRKNFGKVLLDFTKPQAME
jgi:NADPH:quinone reductase-like Zn-dependent oxidoreductase